MEYRVITAPTLDTLEDTVNPMICGGWEPQGGVSATLLDAGGGNGRGERWRYHQAIVKHYRRFSTEPLAAAAAADPNETVEPG